MTTDRPINTFRQVLTRIAWTVCSSMPIPLVLLFLMFQLKQLGSDQVLGWSLYRSMATVVPAICVALFLARAFERRGLAEDCFRWPEKLCSALGRNAWFLVAFVCPLLGATVFFRHWEGGLYSNSMGRLALMAAFFVLGQSMWETGSLVVQLESGRPRGSRTLLFAGGKIFRILAVGTPMTLVFLAAIGYRHAAEQLGTRLVWTLLAGAGVLLVAGLATRLVDLQRQRLGKRFAVGSAVGRQQQVELAENFGQVLRLIQVVTIAALLLLVNSVWADVVPLGAALDRVQLWHYAAATSTAASGAVSGGDVTMAAGGVQFVSLRHLMMAGCVLVLTLVASRNLPGLIQLLMPSALPLDKGGRYAVTFVGRYLVGLTGLIQAAVLLGFEWNRVQWLVAGLTVGLGFGLQEVFANLVSGLIILMERPIRVGDFVSVNNVSGTVTKMALRATTIQDSDRREWIVPNKKFIPDDVMNWTLSDTVSRAVFPVSVMHGSESSEVQEILLAQARANPLILDYPEPSVVMARIGGASLDFELRVFLPSRNVFTQVQNDLLVKIEKALRAAGIELELPLYENQERRRRNRKKSRRVTGPSQTVRARNKVAAATEAVPPLQRNAIADGERMVQEQAPENLPESPADPATGSLADSIASTVGELDSVAEQTRPILSVLPAPTIPFRRPDVVFTSRRAA